MKIEKINDRQIRCTLTREDLENREIKLSELAYGTDKAKALFQDMMQVAAQDFGFEADNTPLVIEAVPVSMDSIILIITKVDDPEELDTRFSRFSPENTESAGGLGFADPKERIEGADDILGMIRKIMESKLRALQGENKEAAPADTKAVEEDEEVRSLTRFYLFQSLDDAIRAAAVVDPVYDGPNSLYKNPDDGIYYLLLKKAESPAAQFNRVCNMLSEYAMTGKYVPGLDAHFGEHLEVIVEGNALHSLAQLR